MVEPNGWSEWGKYVLKELERLNSCYESLDNKMTCDVHDERMKNIDAKMNKFMAVMVTAFLTVIVGGIVLGVWVKAVMAQ